MRHRTVSCAFLPRLAAAMAALHLVLFAGFVFSLLAASRALSAEAACEGVDLTARLEAERPAELAQVRAEAAQVEHGRGLLWRIVSPGGAVSHVFGTMHSPDPRITALPAPAEQAFAGAETLVVENLDAADPQRMSAQMLALGDIVFLQGGTLDDLLPAEVLDALKPEAEARGLPWAAARLMQPWMLAAAIARAHCDIAAAQAGAPVLDALLVERAQAQRKQTLGLETVAEQFEAVAGVPQAFHLAGLVDLTQAAGRSEDMMETTKQLYLAGETALLLPLMRLLSPKAYEGEGHRAFRDGVIGARNERMAERALPALEKGGVFMAVGALHLPGPDGVLALLEKQGYVVEPVAGL